MKVELKLNIDTIFAINKILQNVYLGKTTLNQQQEVYRSIGYDLADKFDKLHKTNIKKQTIFDSKKKHKITLKFHEAWALEKIINNYLPVVNDHYNSTILKALESNLNQKLA